MSGTLITTRHQTSKLGLTHNGHGPDEKRYRKKKLRLVAVQETVRLSRASKGGIDKSALGTKKKGKTRSHGRSNDEKNVREPGTDEQRADTGRVRGLGRSS